MTTPTPTGPAPDQPSEASSNVEKPNTSAERVKETAKTEHVDELAIAVERVTAIVMDRSFRGSEVVLGINQNRATIDDLRLMLSRLASQEAEIEEARTLDKGFYKWMIERDLLARGEEVEWPDIVVALTEHENEFCAIIDRKEETIRADGEALEAWAYYDSTSDQDGTAIMIAYDIALEKTRARLAARQEGQAHD